MKVSEISVSTLAEYLRVDDTDGLQMYLDGAIAFVKGYAGLTDDELDAYPEIAICVLAVASDMYDNRQMTVERDKLNPVAADTLDMHSFNLIPSEGEA